MFRAGGNKRALEDQLDPGQLDERMHLVMKDPQGNTTTNIWAERTSSTITQKVRAKVEYGAGSEDMVEGKLSEKSNLRFIIRAVAGMSNEAYFIWNVEKYNIQHIKYIGRRRYTVCSVKKMNE